MKIELTAKAIGEMVKKTRKRLEITQKDLALSSGTGLRFIIDLEAGKATCQLGKAMTVVQTLGIIADFTLPPSFDGL